MCDYFEKYHGEKLRFNSATIHGGQAPDPAFGGSDASYLSNFHYAQTTPGDIKGLSIVAPTTHPSSTREILASIENGKHGLAFASGLSGDGRCIKVVAARR